MSFIDYKIRHVARDGKTTKAQVAFYRGDNVDRLATTDEAKQIAAGSYVESAWAAVYQDGKAVDTPYAVVLAKAAADAAAIKAGTLEPLPFDPSPPAITHYERSEVVAIREFLYDGDLEDKGLRVALDAEIDKLQASEWKAEAVTHGE